MSAAGDYIKTHAWIWGVLGAFVLLVIVMVVLVICCAFWLRQRKKRGVYYVDLRTGKDKVESLSYGSMEMKRSFSISNTPATDSLPTINGSVSKTAAPGRLEPGVAETWNTRRRRRETSQREAALTTCQFYIRNTQTFNFQHPLPDLGSRVAKFWFMVTTPLSQGSEQMILTLTPLSKYCPLTLHQDNIALINSILSTLKHPYLYSVHYIDYLPDHTSVAIAAHYFPKGSLKDIIYRRQPLNEWSEKYSLRKRGLPSHIIPLYGRQILEALRVLYRKGFPPLGNLQSGNIFVEGGHCRLSGYENTLLAFRSRHYRLIKDHPDAIDTIMFGHLLFEMMCGYELTTLSPSNSDWETVKIKEQAEVLKYIFSTTAQENGSFPNIVDILDLPYFKSVQLPETENLDSSQIQLTPEMKALLRTVRKGRPANIPHRTSSVKKRSFSAHASYYPVTQLPQVSGRQPASSPPPPPRSSSRSPPPSAHPPPSPPPDSSDRTALLTDIKKGTRLNRTSTNDRSAPRI